MKPRKRIKQMSDKRRAELGHRAIVRETVLYRAKGQCEARIEHICLVRATEVHEVWTRGRGGSWIDEENCLALCSDCHSYVTTHPRWALEAGFVVHAPPLGESPEPLLVEAHTRRVHWALCGRQRVTSPLAEGFTPKTRS